MPSLDQAIERLYDLRVGVVGKDHARHERPHKPLLLLAVLDLLDEGLATPGRIPWSQALRDRFTRRFEIVRQRPLLPPHDPAFAPDPAGLAWRMERLSA